MLGTQQATTCLQIQASVDPGDRTDCRGRTDFVDRSGDGGNFFYPNAQRK